MKLFFSFIAISLTYICNAQYTFIANDSVFTFDIKIIENNDFNNGRVCMVELNNKIINYSPYEISEYQFKNGRHFISQEINVNNLKQKLFLEKLTSGNYNLYYLKLHKGKKFFIQKNNEVLIELNKSDSSYVNDSYKKILNQLDTRNEFVDFVHYKKSHLKLYIERLNSGTQKPFPYFKYGPLFGISIEKCFIFSESNSTDRIATDYDANFVIGVYGDIPISLTSFTFHPEFYYTANKHSAFKKIYNSETTYLFRYESLNFPIIFRYTLPTKVLRPFINIGFEYVRLFNYKHFIYKTITNDNEILIYDQSNKLTMSLNQILILGGIGFEYHFTNKHFIFFETRYANQIITDKKSYAKKNEIQLNFGFNL
jgi:hypothetical protein